MAATADGPELSILIVSYNCKAVTLECLASLMAHPPSISHEIILLDNASVDGTVEAVAASFPQIRLIAHPDNSGFAAGNNLAAALASGRRLLLLNPDTLVFATSLDALWAFAERAPQRGIWGGRTLFADHSLNPTSCWAAISLWSLFCSTFGLTWFAPRSTLFNPEAYGGWLRNSERDVDIVTGCFLLIDHALWRQLGGFDQNFFMYAEEADLCLRARQFGAKPGISPAAEIVHLGGASEASQTEKLIKISRGRITLMRKHWGPAKLAIGLMLYRLWALLRLIGSRFLSGPRDIPGQSAEKWRTIWQRRAEWLAGY
jgi:N-acetylglucosaminyl-diphospho-decaprenol L-rhamnosyltransferase